MINNITEINAIQSLVPNALFHTDENGIVWHEDNTLPKPSDADINFELLRLIENAPLLDEIRNLEASQTPRVLREAALGNAFAIAKIKSIDAAVSLLRAKLK